MLYRVLCYIILYCDIVYYTVRCYTILYCIVIYYIILYYTIRCYIILYYMMLCYIRLDYILQIFYSIPQKFYYCQKLINLFFFSSITIGINKNLFFNGTDGKIFFSSKYLKTFFLLNDTLIFIL